MRTEIEKATAAWQREVEAEAIKLIEGGTPPLDAIVISANRLDSLKRSTGPRLTHAAAGRQANCRECRGLHGRAAWRRLLSA